MATIVDQETDVRFWAQTGFKPGQKLDPKNPTDAKMIVVWKDIRAKVQSEADAGKLVTTFDKLGVAKNLADAEVADKAATAHLDAAVKAPDPETVKANIDAATIAAKLSSQKTQEAAQQQPATLSPRRAHDVAHETARTPPPLNAPAKDHLAHAQAQALKPPMPPQHVLAKEANARFWAQTNYKVNQNLDPKNPQDRAQMPVWMDIYRKVQREAAEGKLLTTYDKIGVAQNLADAQIADKAATAHLDAATKTSDVNAIVENTKAATIAAQIAAQKAREAAKLQPPTVSPKLADDAVKKVAETPPLPKAEDQIARGKMLKPEDDPWSDEYKQKQEQLAKAKAKSKSPREAGPALPPREVLFKETNARFWARTGYKPDQKLDMTNPTDRSMSKVWLEILREVEREARAGKLVLTPVRPPAPPPVTPPAPPPRHPQMRHPQHVPPPMPPQPQPLPHPMPRPMPQPMPPHVPMMQPPPMRPPHLPPPPRPPQMRHPQHVPHPSAPPVQPQPPVVPTPPGPPGPPVPAPDVAEKKAPPEEPTKKLPLGKILAIAAGFVVVGGVAYAATRKKSSPSARSRSPRAFAAATPAGPVRRSAA